MKYNIFTLLFIGFYPLLAIPLAIIVMAFTGSFILALIFYIYTVYKISTL